MERKKRRKVNTYFSHFIPPSKSVSSSTCVHLFASPSSCSHSPGSLHSHFRSPLPKTSCFSPLIALTHTRTHAHLPVFQPVIKVLPLHLSPLSLSSLLSLPITHTRAQSLPIPFISPSCSKHSDLFKLSLLHPFPILSITFSFFSFSLSSIFLSPQCFLSMTVSHLLSLVLSLPSRSVLHSPFFVSSSCLSSSFSPPFSPSFPFSFLPFIISSFCLPFSPPLPPSHFLSFSPASPFFILPLSHRFLSLSLSSPLSLSPQPLPSLFSHCLIVSSPYLHLSPFLPNLFIYSPLLSYFPVPDFASLFLPSRSLLHSLSVFLSLPFSLSPPSCLLPPLPPRPSAPLSPPRRASNSPHSICFPITWMRGSVAR